MTRDEAIMILKNEQPHCGKRALFPEEKRYEAYDVAIKALEQQTCEDAVSREAAIDALKQAYWNKDMQNAKDDPCIVDAMTDWAIRTIKDLPSVKPQYTEDEIQKMQDLERAEIQKAYELGKTEGQKIGHWIEHDHGFDAKYYQCPICKGYDGSPKGKYCKWCGTKMIEPQMIEPQERSDEE